MHYADKVKQYIAYLEKTHDIEYDLQSGLAGYLYCLLSVHMYVEGVDVKEHILKVVNRLYSDGLKPNFLREEQKIDKDCYLA